MTDFPVVDGLTWLSGAVRAELEALRTTAAVSVGWKEASQQINQGEGGANRIVFVPSRKNGAGGELVAPKTPGDREVKDATGKVVAYVRAIRDWKRAIEISVWAYDSDAPEDEDKQQAATVKLFEKLLQATTRTAPTALVFGSTDWVRPELERQFGRSLVVQCTFQYPLFDVPVELAFPENVAVTKDLNPDSED